MKSRNREINIFNLSMLDVISGALGAFLIIMIVLLPYYKKESIDFKKENTQLKQELESSRQAQAEAERQRAEAESRMEKCREALAKTFLVIYITWDTAGQDVDLHVVDPQGHEFYYEKKAFPGVPGELSQDWKIGPGNEVWEIRDAPPGVYKIYYELYERNGNPKDPVIAGKVYHRDSTTDFPSVTLSKVKVEQFVTNLTVHPDGTVTLGQ